MEDILTAQEELAEVIKDNTNVIADIPDATWTSGLITSRLRLLEKYWQDFQANHVALMQSPLALDHPYRTERTYAKIEAAFVAAQGRLLDADADMHPQTNHRFSFAPPASSTPHPAPSRGSARLPRIQVPEFNGHRDQWESFRDMFKSLIHDDQSLSEVEKLFYLKTHVKGEARSVLESFQVTGANYNAAWHALEQRYDNSRLLVQDHIRALKNLRPLKEESAAGLQHLQDELRRHRDQLRTLGRPVEGWDDWLISCAVDAMDPKTRRAWETILETQLDITGNQRRHPSYDQLAEFLDRQCRTVHALEHPQMRRPTAGVLKASETRPLRVHATSHQLPAAVLPAVGHIRPVDAPASDSYQPRKGSS